MAVSMGGLSDQTLARLKYIIEEQGGKATQGAIDAVNAAIDRGKVATQGHTKITEQATAAFGLKIRAIDMLVGRFVLYGQALLQAKMVVEAVQKVYIDMIEEAVKHEETLEAGVRTLTTAIDAEKTAISDLKAARVEYAKDDIAALTFREAAAHEAAALAIKRHGDAYSSLMSYVSGGGAAAPVRPGTPHGPGYGAHHGGTPGQTSRDLMLSNITTSVEQRLGALGHPPSAYEIAQVADQIGALNGLTDLETKSIVDYEAYKYSHLATPKGPTLVDQMSVRGLSKSQTGVAAEIIGRGRLAGLNETQITALLTMGLGESSLGANPGDPRKLANGVNHLGLFQMAPGWMGFSGDRGDNLAQIEHMIGIMKRAERDHITPYGKSFDWAHATPGEIALAMENSDEQPSYYGKFEQKARGLIATFDGVPSGVYGSPPKPKKDKKIRWSDIPGWAGFDNASGAPSFRPGIGGERAAFPQGDMSEGYRIGDFSDLTPGPYRGSVKYGRAGLYDPISGAGYYGRDDIIEGNYTGDIGWLQNGEAWNSQPYTPDRTDWAAQQRRVERNARYRQNAYGAAGAFASGGFGGAASFGLDLISPGLGSIGLPLLGKLGKVFGIGGGHKNRDIGLTPSQPVYVSDVETRQLISQFLNVYLPTIAGRAGAAVDRATGQLPTFRASAGGVR